MKYWKFMKYTKLLHPQHTLGGQSRVSEWGRLKYRFLKMCKEKTDTITSKQI